MPNFEKYFKPVNQSKFIATVDGVNIVVSGDDPWFETSFPIEFGNNNSILSFFSIDSQAEGDLQAV